MNKYIELKKELEKDRVKNSTILNYIYKDIDFDFYKSGKSYIFKLQRPNDEEWKVNFSAYKEDIDELLQYLEEDDKHFSCIERWMYPYVTNGKTVKYNEECHKLYLPDSVQLDPPKMKIEPIREEDIAFVDSQWPFRSETSVEYFRHVIKTDISGAIYIDNKIAAWCIMHNDGSLGSMHVMEEYRRKNFAYDITSYMVSKLREEKRLPFIFIVEGNIKSISLAKKIGFVETTGVNWVHID